MVLAVDDLQWCDTGSLRALGVPAAPAGGAAGAHRRDPAHRRAAPGRGAASPSWPRTWPPCAVHPGPLDADATSYLVRERLGADAHDTFVAACHRTTGGNPLLLRQLLRALQVEGVRPDASHADTVNAIGSRAVSSMVLMRLGRLPADCTAVARAIAVLGDGCELVDVATLAGLDERAAAGAIATLARAEVLRPDRPLGFVHPLVGDAVYQALSGGERELSHERAAARADGSRGDAGAGGRAPHARAAPRRPAGRPAAARGRGDGGGPGRCRRGPHLPGAGAGRAADERRPARAAARAGPARDADRRPGRDRSTCGTPTRRPWTRRGGPRSRTMLARTLVFAGGPGEATAVRPQRGGRAAGGPGRRPAGAARPGADRRLHARAAGAGVAGRSPGAAGRGPGRPDARGDAGLGGADRQRRPGAVPRAGPVRAGRRRAAAGRHRAALGGRELHPGDG